MVHARQPVFFVVHLWGNQSAFFHEYWSHGAGVVLLDALSGWY